MMRRILQWLGLRKSVYIIKIASDPNMEIVTKRSEMRFMPPPGFLAIDEEQPYKKALGDD